MKVVPLKVEAWPLPLPHYKTKSASHFHLKSHFSPQFCLFFSRDAHNTREQMILDAGLLCSV